MFRYGYRIPTSALILRKKLHKCSPQQIKHHHSDNEVRKLLSIVCPFTPVGIWPKLVLTLGAESPIQQICYNVRLFDRGRNNFAGLYLINSFMLLLYSSFTALYPNNQPQQAGEKGRHWASTRALAWCYAPPNRYIVYWRVLPGLEGRDCFHVLFLACARHTLNPHILTQAKRAHCWCREVWSFCLSEQRGWRAWFLSTGERSDYFVPSVPMACNRFQEGLMKLLFSKGR